MKLTNSLRTRLLGIWKLHSHCPPICCFVLFFFIIIKCALPNSIVKNGSTRLFSRLHCAEQPTIHITILSRLYKNSIIIIIVTRDWGRLVFGNQFEFSRVYRFVTFSTIIPWKLPALNPFKYGRYRVVDVTRYTFVFMHSVSKQNRIPK